jgi:dienelactone hydrolase
MSWIRAAARGAALACAIAGWTVTAASQELLSALREEVVTVRKPGFIAIELEATLYRPAGDGPFPLIVINHGKANGNPRFQERARYPVAAGELVRRGYAVVIPMRQGFSKSQGSYIGGGCNVESNGRAQADDVVATLQQFAQRSDIDARRVVVFGQSHGGLTTMALGSRGLPNIVGLVNFAGGLRQENCNAWEAGLATAMASYARQTPVPSLWFYGDNDSYFTPAVWRDMYQSYVGAGGHARLVAFGRFGNDSHSMFSSKNGTAIWLPEVDAFFKELGLPFAPRP